MVWLGRNWFLVGIILVCLLGLAAPRLGPSLRPWTPFLVALILFLVGLEQHFEALRRSFLNWTAILLTLIFSFLAAPLAAVAIGRMLYGADAELFYGLVLLAAVPTTMASSVVWTRLGGGDTALSVILVLATTGASIVLLPWILDLLLSMEVELPAGQMMLTLLYTVALPVVTAQVISTLFPVVRRLGNAAAAGGQALILVLILTAVADSATRLTLGLVLEVSASTLLLHLVLAGGLLAVTGWLGIEHRDRVAVFFASSQKTITVALLVGLSYFSGLAALASVFYHVIQNFASLYWVRWLRQREVALTERRVGSVG